VNEGFGNEIESIRDFLPNKVGVCFIQLALENKALQTQKNSSWSKEAYPTLVFLPDGNKKIVIIINFVSWLLWEGHIKKKKTDIVVILKIDIFVQL